MQAVDWHCFPAFVLSLRERLKSLYGGRVIFHGGVENQKVLPRGTPEDVRAAVRADVDTYGRFRGGLIARGEIAGDFGATRLPQGALSQIWPGSGASRIGRCNHTQVGIVG